MWAEHPLCNFSVSFFVFNPVWCLGACGLLLAQRPHEGEQGEGIVMGTALPLCSPDRPGDTAMAVPWVQTPGKVKVTPTGHSLWGRSAPSSLFSKGLVGGGGGISKGSFVCLCWMLCCVVCVLFFFFKNFSICPAALSLLSKLAYCGGSTCALPWPALGGQTGFSHLMSRLPPSLPKRFCTSLKA